MVASRAPAAPAGSPESAVAGERSRLRLDESTVGRLAWSLVVGAILLRAWVHLSLPLSQGDFISLAEGVVVGADPARLLTALGSPASPVELASSWVAVTIAPGQAWGPGLLMAVGWACCAVLAWWALRALLGRRPIALIPLAMFAFSPLSLPGTSRWDTAPAATAMLAAALLALWAAGLLHRGDVAGAAWRAGLASVIALAASGNPLVTVTVILAIALAVPLLVPGPDGRAAAVRRSWPIWSLPLAATVTAWFASAAQGWPFLANPQDWGSVAATVGTALSQGIVPALLGGPIAWAVPSIGSAPLAAPSILLVLAAWEALILGAFVLAIRFRPALRWWAAAGAGCSLVAIAPALAVDRAVPLAAASMTTLATGVALTSAAVAVSLAGAVRPGSHPSGPGSGRRVMAVAVAVVVDLCIVAAALSTSSWRSAWIDQSDADWLRTASASLAAADPAIPLLDQPVPVEVMSPALAPRNTAATVFAGVADRPEIANSTSDLLLFDAEGSLVPGVVEGISIPDVEGPLDTDAACTWRSSGSSLTIPLDTYIGGPSVVAAIEYDITGSAETTVSLVPPTDATTDSATIATTDVALRTGPGMAYVSLAGPGIALQISRIPQGTTLCIARITIGIPTIPINSPTGTEPQS